MSLMFACQEVVFTLYNTILKTILIWIVRVPSFYPYHLQYTTQVNSAYHTLIAQFGSGWYMPLNSKQP